MVNFIAIICGLKSEAAVVRKAVGDDARIRIGVSGANAARAEEAATRFCAGGARAILSVGVCGGLNPALAPGDLILGDKVIVGDGSVWASDLALLKSLILSPAGENARCGALYGSDRVIADTDEKKALFSRHASLAVDMESHGAARAATAAKVPFLAIRAVADPAGRALPKAALAAVAPDGSTRMFATLAAALRDPGQFPQLLKLGADSGKALKTLRRDFGGLLGALFVSLDL